MGGESKIEINTSYGTKGFYFFLKTTSVGRKQGCFENKACDDARLHKVCPNPCANKNAHRDLKPLSYTERVICQHQQIDDLYKAFLARLGAGVAACHLFINDIAAGNLFKCLGSAGSAT